MADAGPAAASDSPRRPASRLLRAVGLLLVVLALLWALARFALPSLIQSQIQRHGSEALGRELQVERVEVAPFDLALTLHGISLAAAASDADRTPQLTLRRLLIDIDARSLLRLAPVLRALQVEAPRLRLAHTAPGRWDVDDIIERLASRPPPAQPAEPARFALYNLQLSDGELRFDDRPVQRRHEVSALQLALPFLSNIADDVKVQVEPRLAFRFDGATVDLRGHSLPFSADRASELALTLTELDLSRWWAYLPAQLAFTPRGGVLSTKLALRFAQPPQQLPQVQLSGELSVGGLAVHAAGQAEPLLAWKTLAVQMSDVQPLQRRVALAKVALDGAALDLQRDAAGRLNLLPAAPGAPKAAPVTDSAPAEAKPWQISVQRAEIQGAALRWRDATTKPAADLELRDFSASADGLQWPSEQSAALQLTTQVHAAGRPVASLGAEGKAGLKSAELALSVDALQLAALAPYLRAVFAPGVEGQFSAQAQLNWADTEPQALALAVKQARLDKLRLHEDGLAPQRRAAAYKPALDVSSMQFDDLQLDLARYRARLGSLRIDRPQLQLRRNAQGVLNVQRWVVEPAPAAKADADAKQAERPPEKPWTFEARDAKVEGAQIGWTDEMVASSGEPHQIRLQGLRLALQNLRWPAAPTPMPLQLSTALAAGPEAAPAGRAELRGQAGLAPLSLRGALQLERVAAALFEPYAAAALPVRIERAEAGWRGDIAVAQEAAGWRVDARGEALIADLDLRSRPRSDGAPMLNPADTQLLAWQSLRLAPLQFALAPGGKPRLQIDEVTLADFYARLVVTEQGRFNLSDVQPPAAATAAPAAASAAAPAAAQSAGLPLDLLIGRTRLMRGKIDFSDRFVRPNYSAALSELEGSIGRLASGTREMAPIELRGRVAGTGLLDIRGALNPTANPLALDIQARATDLELAPLSPYSGKYAGYAIERGKLSVDVSYKVDADGRLEANNQIVLNQLTFGEKVDSPDATKLPVRFALALLADRNGVIDINLPVSGSINDPQFSVFGIVLKLIGNLLVKAVTAPFSLLFGGSGGDEASTLAFEPGSARLAASALPALDRVAKALADRPALRLTVSGSADASEADALRQELLRRALLDEQRRERARAGAASDAADSASALPEAGSAAHAALVERLYTRTSLPDKPRNLIGMAKAVPLPQMEAMLRAAMPMPADGWRELALQRGLVVRDALIARGLPSERLFLGAPKPREAAEADWTPRASLVLSPP